MNSTTTRFSFWRTLLRTAALVAFVILLPLAHASTRWATLEAIHQLENPTDSPRPGPYGELGAYQFRAAVWHKYTHVPFSRALDRATSDQIAVMHYEYLKRELAKAGIEPSTYNIALCWNGGLGGAKHDTAPTCAHDYAERAQTLAQQYDRISMSSRVAVN